ncbi:hypothetical protein J437_LFUL018903 [Ladona fulva]|uniref:Uncharacterized protein n=1 Tax=Ladona fulva TaxID=123851 RepID=A0A8K0KQB0_LADFU|nr:hypothetical protein J437_LFUL018903 [Ladona fulva]
MKQSKVANQISKLRIQIGRLTQHLFKGLNQRKLKHIIEMCNNHKYNPENIQSEERMTELLDTLKQQLSVLAKRLKRYKTCTERKQQNYNFQTNERQFYTKLSRNQVDDTETPNYWRNTRSNKAEHNQNARWITHEYQKMENIPEITMEPITKKKLWK